MSSTRRDDESEPTFERFFEKIKSRVREDRAYLKAEYTPKVLANPEAMEEYLPQVFDCFARYWLFGVPAFLDVDRFLAGLDSEISHILKKHEGSISSERYDTIEALLSGRRAYWESEVLVRVRKKLVEVIQSPPDLVVVSAQTADSSRKARLRSFLGARKIGIKGFCGLHPKLDGSGIRKWSRDDLPDSSIISRRIEAILSDRTPPD